jgi:membrane-associated protease RseP (regulator of RpoE activity)
MAVLAAFLALMGVTVAHEAGHYLAVRLRGGRVLRVQVGLGPIAWQRRHGDADLLFGLIPLGGRIHYDGIPTGPAPPSWP